MSDVIRYADSTASGDVPRGGLCEILDFGSNPGNLRMYIDVPPAAEAPAALVVVLHGCRQDVRGYDKASGWSRLAAAHGFMLLYPEQRPTNNQDGCFQWFEAAQMRRGSGEVASVRQMIATAIDRFDADPARIFVTGLSAGGAMAGALLATYPEVFAGGAIIAGLPYGTASNLSEARSSMGGRTREAKAWGDLVRMASPHAGSWPTVAVWHGTADRIVNPINSGELVKQWTNVHGIGAAIPAEDNVGQVTRRRWSDKKGRVCVVDYSVPGLAHGAPVDEATSPAPFFLPAGVSSTRYIARDWGLTERRSHRGAVDGRGIEETSPALADGPEPSSEESKPRRRFWSMFGH